MSKDEMEELLVSYGVDYTSTLADKLIEIIEKERADVISTVDEKMADILAGKCSKYGVASAEAYCESYCELEDWIAEQLKEQTE